MSNEALAAALNTPYIATAKIFSFESLSGSCRLQGAIGYEVGTKDHLHIRVLSSDGPGKFNTCWWSLADIEKALSKVPEHEPFKASELAPVFYGRSVNTMYYVIGAILSLSMLKRADPVENGYVRNVPAELLSELEALISAATDLSPPSMEPGAGPMVVAIPKAAKKSAKKPATPATA